jgi:coproporphyrinogen III oxidase
MGSLPSFINKALLKSWAQKVETPQDILVNSIVEVIDDNGIIDENTKEKLATVVREHYKKYPESLKYQASGNTIPSTVANHKK